MAILANHPLEVEIASTAEPVTGHAMNLEGSLTLNAALLHMAVALDEDGLSALPCSFEPAVDPGTTAARNGAHTARTIGVRAA